MNPLTSKKSWLVSPILFLLGYAVLTAIWAVMDTEPLIRLFDNNGASPVELMTLPLFALIVPLVWLCPPNAGTARRQAGWAALWSLLGFLAIVRETDLHEALFVSIWPDVANGFRGTVFKMRFLKAPDIPLMPKLFVIAFFAIFISAAAIPLIRYIVPLFRDFFRRKPVAWASAFFGITTVMVLLADRLPSNFTKSGHPLSRSVVALFRAFEEGGEMMMALFALLAILMSYLHFGCNETRLQNQ